MSLWKACGAGVMLCALPCVAVAQTPDLEAAATAIVKSDADFAQSVAGKNRGTFLSFLADATTFNGGTADEIHGRDAVMKEWAVFFEPDGPTLTWTPIKGEALGAGDVGYTIGRSIFRRRGPDGTMTERRGQYITIWRKQADGSWTVVFDTGSTAP